MAGALGLALEMEADLIAIEAAMDEAIAALRRRRRTPSRPPGWTAHDEAHMPGRTVIIPGYNNPPQWIGEGK